MMLDLGELIDRMEATVESHALGVPGAYTRYTRPDPANARNVGLDPYGVADAANILYTIGRFPSDSVTRASWIEALRGLQDPATGMYRDATHHEIHTTAHCIAALELFDAKPRHSVQALASLKEPATMERFLDGLNWKDDPWNASHQGAGLYVALVLTGAVGMDWQDRYFGWLWEESDPATGFLRRGYVPDPRTADGKVFHHLAGTFHYLFNMEYARRPLRYPAAMVDSCLEIRRRNVFAMTNWVGFSEIDWVYCLNRAVRQSGHRYREVREALETMASDHVAYLMGLDWRTHGAWDDLHCLFGALCSLAELQQALPGFLRTPRPLRLVLDRRPFI
jgi:hypothetical protein